MSKTHELDSKRNLTQESADDGFIADTISRIDMTRRKKFMTERQLGPNTKYS